MDNRNPRNLASHPLSFQAVRDKEPDRSYYVTHKLHRLQHFMTRTLNDISRSIWETLSFDHMDFSFFQQAVWPAVASGAALLVGECVAELATAQTGDEDTEYALKFLVGAALLGYSVTYRLTEEKPQTPQQLAVSVARETMAIAYLYQSTYAASQDVFSKYLDESGSLIMSLGATTVAVPGLVSYAVKAYQSRALKKAYTAGAQRTDTALFATGHTPVLNIYLQANYFLLTELATVSREFQLGLIAYNILHSKNLLQQFRNFPALIFDAGPPIVKKMLAQHEKISHDYQRNTACLQVLREQEGHSTFISVPRYQLRTNDLVWCNQAFDLSSVPVSGEMIALRRDARGNYTQNEPLKFSVNLKSHNGEQDVWIEYTANTHYANYQYVDLHHIRDGKQAGVLAGAKLNLYGSENFFVKIKEEAERILDNDYEKTAVINQIITKHKRQAVMQAMSLAAVMAILLTEFDFTKVPARSLMLMFNLFQMMIAFAETFVREMVNGSFLKEMNATLGHHPLETIDALRLVDLCNALDGYYPDRFPKGVAIVSDKTGTLTTSRMNVLGYWTGGMRENVQEGPFKPHYDSDEMDRCFDVFAAAYTNSKKELEPEEHAILAFFDQEYKSETGVKVDTLGSNHFRKHISLTGDTATIETWHLGLYRKLGGRFTLVKDNEAYSLVFCGVPRAEGFQGTPLLAAYGRMRPRVGVLSRDWCLARTPLQKKDFDDLCHLFNEDDKDGLEKQLKENANLLPGLEHCCTFLIDNPVKEAAERFIQNCQSINVPVFIATGDTAKAAENIAKVLAPESTQQIFMLRQDGLSFENIDQMTAQTTVIFAGISRETFTLFDLLMMRPMEQRPVIIFAEMSTEGKGVLTRHLKDRGFFVVANGDGANDVQMMRSAHVVMGHLADDGTYAPGVGQLANLNDRQLQGLLKSDKSFYDLFDIHQRDSAFRARFVPMANSQEKVSFALMLKSSKMAFELAQSMGLPGVHEMWQQHWFSVGFDLIWLGIVYYEIMASKNLPYDNRNLNQSLFVRYAQAITIAMAAVQALMTYALTGQSTNVASMVVMLTALPLVLRSIFSGYGYLRHEATPLAKHTIFAGSADALEVKDNAPEVSALSQRKIG